MKKSIIFLILTCYSLTLNAMEDTRITIPHPNPYVVREQECDQLSHRAVELYFRGNAKSLHSTVLPYIRFKVAEANGPEKTEKVIDDLKHATVYGEPSSLSNHIHQLVTESLEEAIKEKELTYKSLESTAHLQKMQRNAAIGTTILGFLGTIAAALTTLLS